MPVAVEPVNEIFATSLCSASGAPASRPEPFTTLSTPAGPPASTNSSASSSADSGEFSAGLSTTELPAASAGAIFHAVIMSGKFHGTMQPTTPSGSRSV